MRRWTCPSPRGEIPALIDGAPYVTRSALTGNPPPAGSPLAGWLDRISERSSVSKAVGQMKEVIAAFPDVATMLAQGQIKRQYRDHRLDG